MSEVARIVLVGFGVDCETIHAQHGIRLVPAKVRLNIHSCLGLYAETDQADHQKERRVDVSFPRCSFRQDFWISFFKTRSPPGPVEVV